MRTRTCIGCAAKGSKESFLRIVRTPSGEVFVDPRGTKDGRGAYVCSQDCFHIARTSRKLPFALRTRMTDDVYNRIEQGVSAALGNGCAAEE